MISLHKWKQYISSTNIKLLSTQYDTLTGVCLYAVSTNLKQNHIATTFAEKFGFRECNNIYVDGFGTLGVNIDTYKKANWIGYILQRNCLLKYVTEGRQKGREEEK